MQTTPTRVALDSLGCKLNQAEIESLARQLAEAGYQVVSSDENPDVYILNTCTVTRVADAKSRHMLRMARRQNPEAKVVAIGCYASRSPGELADIADFVSAGEKSDLLGQLSSRGLLNSPDGPAQYEKARTRAFIKVQEGCANFCAYCIVPMVRPGETSVPADRVVEEVKRAAADGCKEVVLTGTRVGAYGSDGLGLSGLLRRVLAETDIPRVRLSSVQPGELSPGLIDLWQDPRLCPHFHLSLQSGCDSVLARMKRRYSLSGYREAVSLIRERVPDVAITTDIIVGFPGETDAEFVASLETCRGLEFARIHVFPYSAREGTLAASMPGQMEERVKKERARRMLALARAAAGSFRERFLGRTMTVLWEKQSDGDWSGHTGNYIKVRTVSAEDLANKLTPVRLDWVERDGVIGKIVSAPGDSPESCAGWGSAIPE